MNFFEAVKYCLNNYANFTGRASRSEYWYFVLFNFLINFLITIGSYIFINYKFEFFILQIFIYFILFFPSTAVVARRLHDVNKSGWWQLIVLTVIGFIPMIYWLTKESDSGKNTYGINPQSLSSINKINLKTPNTVYKSPIQTPTPTPIKPSEKIVSNDTKEDTVKTDFKPTIEDNAMNDDSYEITEQEQQDLFNQVKITPEEEEQIYADVSKETEPDKRKEGIWTKALIQSDGDEKKTKITYMKLRVEILINELKNSKFNNLINELKEERQKFIDLENDVRSQFVLMKQRQEFDNKENENSRILVHQPVIIDARFDNKFLTKLIGEDYIIKVFQNKYEKYRNGDTFYWMKGSENRIYAKTADLVEEDIQNHYADFIEKVKLLKEYKNK